jgi:anti-sigma regulatory factor (Ser/Thr protein kinase)/anti-anti-sigma regulatory factor
VPSGPLTWHADVRDGLVVVTVNGTIDAESSPALYRALIHCLSREPDAVLVELSGATVADAEAAKTLALIAQRAVSWPGTPVLLCVPDPSAASTITVQCGESLPLFDAVTGAVSALTAHRDVVSEQLLPVPGTARRARDLVVEACLRWDLPHLIAHGALAASELVSNAVVHARTVMTLQVKLRPQYLYIAVFDSATAQPVPSRGHPGTDTPGGRGLHLVELVSARWGCQRRHDGKVVWAAFAVSPCA